MVTLLFLSLSVWAHQSGCAGLLQTAAAREYQSRVHAIVADDVAPADQVAFVGVSRTQLLELVNEGEIHARRWGDVPLAVLPVADRPALLKFSARNGGLLIDAANDKTQFENARAEAWARAVIEAMEPKHPAVRTRGFFGFLNHLRAEIGTQSNRAPTLRQIVEATQFGDLPKGRVTRNAEFRTLVDLLGIPWGGRGNGGATLRHRMVTEAFRDLPAEAGIVLSLNEGALNKTKWDDGGLGELNRIDLDDVNAVGVFTDEDLDLLEALAPNS